MIFDCFESFRTGKRYPILLLSLKWIRAVTDSSIILDSSSFRREIAREILKYNKVFSMSKSVYTYRHEEMRHSCRVRAIIV